MNIKLDYTPEAIYKGQYLVPLECTLKCASVIFPNEIRLFEDIWQRVNALHTPDIAQYCLAMIPIIEIFNSISEDITPEHFKRLAKAIKNESVGAFLLEMQTEKSLHSEKIKAMTSDLVHFFSNMQG